MIPGKVHPLSLEARITRKARITGLPRWEAAILVMDEVEELERRLGRPVLVGLDEELFLSTAPEKEPIGQTVERIQNEYAQDVYLYKRRSHVRVVVLAVAAIVLALAFLTVLARAAAHQEPAQPAPCPVTAEGVLRC